MQKIISKLWKANKKKNKPKKWGRSLQNRNCLYLVDTYIVICGKIYNISGFIKYAIKYYKENINHGKFKGI